MNKIIGKIDFNKPLENDTKNNEKIEREWSYKILNIYKNLLS